MRLFAARVCCLIGIILAIVGVLTVFLSYGASIAVGVAGVVFGVPGYAIGARWLGGLTVVLCVAVLVLGVAAGQGLISGFEGYGR
jgi:hypothetical protein